MIKYKDIIDAKELLNIPDMASSEEIKSNFRKLIIQWHPDGCKENKEKCNEMTRSIIAAYNTINIYCNQYKFSFKEEAIKRYLSDEDWWMERFGADPLWG